MERRQFIKKMGFSTGAIGTAQILTGASLLNPKPETQKNLKDFQSNILTLFFQPSKLSDRSQRYSAWSNDIAVKDGVLYNFISLAKFGEDGSRKTPQGLSIARSKDGVHWEDIKAFSCPLEHAAPGYTVRWNGESFVYYVTESNVHEDRSEYPVIVSQYRTKDLENWHFMGNEYITRPEKQYYRVRWAELVILKDKDSYYGYISSEPNKNLAIDSMGMLKSKNGMKWDVLPPPEFIWDGIPRQHMEVGFCEKINGRYYLGMGSRAYMGHLGYSMMTFVSDSPTGPFYPDKEAFRLCGNTSRDINWLAKTFHLNGEILLNNWITPSMDKSYRGIFASGRYLWVGPLKKLITDREGHLRIAWWPGNEAAKESEVQPDIQKTIFEHPSPAYQKDLGSININSEERIIMKAGHDGTIAMLPVKFDFNQGIILEGNLKAIETHGNITTHMHPAAAGFFFEEEKGKGMLVQMETLGLTRIGIFEYKSEPAFDAFEYNVASWGNTSRGGNYFGLSRFAQEDVIGPLGYAPPCGVTKNVSHKIRLLVKRGMFEIYLDDMYVQTYITGEASGRLGLFAKSGTIEFNDLKMWVMTPDSIPKETF